MTNSLRGAVPFEVDGASYTLRLTTNAQVRYEDAAGETVVQAIAAILDAEAPMTLKAKATAEERKTFQAEALARKKGLAKRLRRLFWAGVSPSLSEEAAGDLMDAMERGEAVNLIGQAFRLAMPEYAAGNAPKAATEAAPETEKSAA